LALDHLAGFGLLLHGRHELYVSALAALLESHGARVRIWGANRGPPARLPAGTKLAILESPLPAELRQIAAFGVPVIVVAERAEPEDRLIAAQLGAADLLAKNASLADLSLAIKRAFEPRSERSAERERHELTPRQREVLGLIVEGLDNRAIAARLGISERTARAHVSSVLKRLGAGNRTQAAVAAVRRGLVVFLAYAVLLTLGSGDAGAAQPAANKALRGTLSSLMRSAGGRSSAWIYDLDARKRLLDWNGARKLTPASIEKLFTSATALNDFGPDARFDTTVLATGIPSEGVLDGDLWVKGGGDPSFGNAPLAQLADLVAKTGIDHLNGRVYGDESYFDSRRGGPVSGFATSRYVGPLSALAFNHGTLAPVGHGFQPDPPRFVAERLTAGLRRRDVEVERAARAGQAPAGAHSVASVSSPTLAELVRHMNLFSDNYYAETLIKGLGARFGGAGSTVAGATVVRRFAKSRRISSRVADGSGLSRANSISPRAVVRLLATVEGDPWFDALYGSLPLAGVSGTLHKRMRGTAAAGRCRAKTGTLIAVSGLAGYCRSASGHRIAFALLMNRVNVLAARRAQDRIAAKLAAYRG
jgi:D-alanyl-D-alanine carboxypeptidase/D-alanyl-D-alanine-endopeptidase (penicillin-binding protein 4)